MTVDPDAFQLGPDRADAPAVLCLHGLTGTPYEVRRPAEALSRAGFHCVGPLLPGHGTSWRELARTPRQAWLEAACEAYDRLAQTRERVYVMGLSMGGVLSLALCQQRAVAGMVVLAAPLRLRLFARLGSALLGRLVSSVPKVPSVRDPVARERHPGYRRMPLAAVRQLIHLQAEVRAGLGRVDRPTQLIYSRGDPTVHPSNAEQIRRSIASEGVDLRWVHNSGHLLTVDYEAEQVASWVVGFLQTLESRN